ncbi:MAG: proline dehydrogenase family protein [Chlorobi bacterium]|nr:proline dehydrogenase family protein [Chlorobiota bacterium]
MLNKIIVATMPLVPKSIVHIFAKKYIAGDTLNHAVEDARKIEAEGGMTTIDVLGEFVDNKERAIHETGDSLKVVDAIHEHKLTTYLSLKPTSLGLGINEEFGYENIKSVVEKAQKLNIRVRLDMENSPFTTKTLNLYKRLRDEGFDNVGTVIQSYMRRSEDDIKDLLPYKPNIRLCKGIYKEAPEVAFQEKEEVRDNYKILLRLLMDNNCYTGIATHDDPLIDDAREYLKENNISKDKYEFQVLLGVREPKRRELIKEGHPLRVYVPFGEDWYGYSTRRLKENPDMVGHIVKAIFSRK